MIVFPQSNGYASDMASLVQDSSNIPLIQSALSLNRCEKIFLTMVRKTFARIYAKNLVSMYLGELSHIALM
jgi:hypothetical protein